MRHEKGREDGDDAGTPDDRVAGSSFDALRIGQPE
jgi:hypothetical protein